MMMIKKLTILDHPNPEEFDINDETEFRSTILWLEDQKIRHYRIEDRDSLRNIGDPGWECAFKKYQTELGSPVTESSHLEQLTWLVSLAVRYEYGDDAARYNADTFEKSNKQVSVPDVVSTDPLDGLDFSSDAFVSGVARVATLGCVGPHYDPRVRLGALASVVKTAPHPPPKGPVTEKADSPQQVIDLLFLSELRSLQTSVNETLVAIQRVTANPKTDTSLGKVGF